MNDTEKLFGINIEEGLVKVEHKNLERSGGSSYRSKCPKCKDGTLLLVRHGSGGILSAHDRCILCGQVFQYLDIEELRKKERGE